MRVLVMGRSLFYVRGLSAELGDRGLDVVGCVRTVSELSESLGTSTIDAVLVCLPGALADARGCALAITSVLVRYPGTALLALTAGVSAPPSRLWNVVNAAWDALPMESADTDSITASLRRLTAGPARTTRATARSDATLTTSEQRVLDLLAVGLSNDAIAHHLCVSPKTVETHVSKVFGKLGLVSDDHTTNRRVLAALRWTGV